MRDQDLVSLTRRIAADEMNNVKNAQDVSQEIGARELIPHDPQTGALSPPDATLFTGTENADLAPETFLAAGLACRVQLIVQQIPPSVLLALIPETPPGLPAAVVGALAQLRADGAALVQLGDRTILDCYRRVRN